MFLIAGITLPPDMSFFFQTMQGLFPSKAWHRVPYLYLPLVTLGRADTPFVLEELDFSLLSVRMRTPVKLQHTGYTVVRRGNRIMLEALLAPTEIDHLSVKIRQAGRRAGLAAGRLSTPFGVPLADVTTVSAEEVSLWLGIHRQLCPQREEIYNFTVFSTQKTEYGPGVEAENHYPFTPHAMPPHTESEGFAPW
ncbi:hypothetical protein K2X14_05365 [Acetobacter sp. TBRC 12305]|uniref:Uncharacterized protein n=1 Tax=Acetobacter garciniae TaxID=2817435 RepID=A0A939KPY6_9PROT|nr:hypothetical protein [Acetobacter garciniae]MBO1324582.1 hypothetical protein [Acetobacter garciniae]MBX0344271.1 hypothetical protein [Acetobacter garciniae]